MRVRLLLKTAAAFLREFEGALDEVLPILKRISLHFVEFGLYLYALYDLTHKAMIHLVGK
jgi:hypothetical protein